MIERIALGFSCASRKCSVLVAILTTASLATTAAAGGTHQLSFTGLGLFESGSYTGAAGVSNFGQVVTGFGNGPLGSRAFRWTPTTGKQILAVLPGHTASSAGSLDDSGSYTVGYSSLAGSGQVVAVRWNGNSPESLGTLPGGSGSAGYGISANGAVVVGTSESANGRRAFRWTAEGGMQNLGLLSGDTISYAQSVSADGSTVVGYSSGGPGPQHAYRWTQATGMQPLVSELDFPHSYADAVNADGSVITGFVGTTETHQAFRWTESGGVEPLGNLPGGENSRGHAINRDGSMIVGTMRMQSSGYRAMMWTAETGMVDFGDYLVDLGVDLTGWHLFAVYAMSEDGKSFVGSGIHQGRTEAWVVTIPAPHSAVGILCLGVVCVRRRRSHVEAV